VPLSLVAMSILKVSSHTDLTSSSSSSSFHPLSSLLQTLSDLTMDMLKQGRVLQLMAR
jgi:hypothetical protein